MILLCIVHRKSDQLCELIILIFRDNYHVFRHADRLTTFSLESYKCEGEQGQDAKVCLYDI